MGKKTGIGEKLKTLLNIFRATNNIGLKITVINGKAKISTHHCSHIFQPILMKVKTKKDIRDTTPQAKFG